MKINVDRLLLEVRRSRRAFILLIGLMVLGVVATLMMFSNLSFERPWDSYRTVKVEFADVKGSTPGHQPVRIAGVNVGVVRDWAVDGDKAVLTLAIRSKYGHLYRDARARIRPVTPLQDMYVALDRGTPRAGTIPDGGRLRAAQTTTPVDISRVLNVFDADTRVQLGELLRGLGKGLDDGGAQLRESFVKLVPFLASARDLTRALSDKKRELARLVHTFGGVTDALAKRDKQLAGLVSNGNATLGELAQHDVALGGTLDALPGTVAALRTSLAAVSGAEDELDPALRALQPVADKLKPGLAALRTFSDDATPALRALVPAVGDLQPLARSVAPVADNAATAIQRLRPQISEFDTLTQLVVTCQTTISHFFQWTPSVLKFGDANGANPRAEVSVGADSAPFISEAPDLKRQPKCFDGFKQEDAG